MNRYKKLFEANGKWNHDDACENGVCSSYTVKGEKIKFFVKNNKWIYEGFSNRKKVKGDIPSSYVNSFDEGDINKMTEFAKTLF